MSQFYKDSSSNSISQTSSSFTPQLTFGGSSVGMTAISTGNYVKTGVQVDIMLRISLFAKGSSTGGAQVENLPFTPDPNIPEKWISAWLQNGVLTNIQYTMTCGRVQGGFSICDIYQIPDSDEPGLEMTDANFFDNSILIMSGTYWAES